MRKNILVTGGAGFVGSNLAIAFKKSFGGSKILCLDNLKRRGSELNIARLRRHGVDFLHGDVRNTEDLELDGFRPDLVIECSAEPSVLAGFNTDPSYAVRTNLVGMLNCLELCRKNRSDIIFLSTSRVYPVEKLNALNFTETDTRFELLRAQPFEGASDEGISADFPLRGYRSLYGATKLAAELVMEEYLSMYDFMGVVNRCGVITGPWQMGKVDQGVFVHWVGSHYFKKPLRYFGYGGTGKQVRDLVHIDDLFRLIEWQSGNMDRVNRKTFNVGGGRDVSLSLLETTELCRDIVGNRIEIEGVEQERFADVRIYISDIRELALETGWRPQKSPVEIIVDIFNWIRSNERALRETLFPE